MKELIFEIPDELLDHAAVVVPVESGKELIRCKDCKHNESGVCSWHCSKDYTWCVDDDDYCSVAERKEE